MGCHLRKPVHVEIYGLPGSGKSTVARILATRLRKQGYEVLEPSAEIDSQKKGWRVLTKAVHTGVFFLFHPCNLEEIWRQVCKNGYTSLRGVLTQIGNIAQKLYVYCGNASPRIYVWDEGIVQAAISLSVGGMVTSAENEKWLGGFVSARLMVIKIYIETPMDVVNKRLINRSGGCSRVEKEQNAEKKEELLRKFEQACVEIENPDCHIKTCDMTAEEIVILMQMTIERILLDEAKECFGKGK